MTNDISNLVESYLPRSPFVPSRKNKLLGLVTFGRINPELITLMEHIERWQGLADRIKEESEKDTSKVIKEGKKGEYQREAGLSLGFLMPEKAIDLDRSDVFEKGFADGQSYSLRSKPGEDGSRKVFGGLALIGGSYLTMRPGEIVIDGVMKNISEWVKIGAIGSWAYGTAPMLIHNLFGRDASLSKKLITGGLFAMHRNPYYFGGMMCAGLITSYSVLESVIYNSPNMVNVLGMVAGSAVMFAGLDKKRKLDEIALSREFGQEYEDYKKRTPAYIPNPLNLFRKSTN